MSVFLALDQGTTSTRALRVTGADDARIVFSAAHKQDFFGSDRVEHDPEELLANLRAALAVAGEVTAIGLSNQGESCLAWDAIDGRPLSPVIVWQDRRTAAQIAALANAQDEVKARCGLPLSPYFSAAKLAWLLDNNTEVKAARRAGRLMLGTTDAFFLQRLTGRAATDITTASRTALMNIATGEWDPRLCELFGVPIECLPPILPTVGDFGLIDGTPVTASVVDQQAALYGHGCRVAGDTKITFGTGAFALSLTGPQLRLDGGNGILPTVAWSIDGQTTYASDGGVLAAGAAVDWAQRIGLLNDPAELDTFEAEPAIDRGLAFVPALAGLGSPYWDDSAAGLFIGMTGATTRRDMQQALIEGIASGRRNRRGDGGAVADYPDLDRWWRQPFALFVPVSRRYHRLLGGHPERRRTDRLWYGATGGLRAWRDFADAGAGRDRDAKPVRRRGAAGPLFTSGRQGQRLAPRSCLLRQVLAIDAARGRPPCGHPYRIILQFRPARHRALRSAPGRNAPEGRPLRRR